LGNVWRDERGAVPEPGVVALSQTVMIGIVLVSVVGCNVPMHDRVIVLVDLMHVLGRGNRQYANRHRDQEREARMSMHEAYRMRGPGRVTSASKEGSAVRG
jgi:hypothetical protein